MSQQSVWEKEYKNNQLVTSSSEPSGDFKRFVKWLKKDQKCPLEGSRVLDLGSGLGKNAIFLSQRGAIVTGLEISKYAIAIAVARAKEADVGVAFKQGDIGNQYLFSDNSFDVVLDVTSSNSLDEAGRGIYLKEVRRVLKSGGYFLVRGLCKDGDKNAENLLRAYPGKEKDTYVMPGIKLVERVFSKLDFIEMYSRYFKIIKLERKSGYAEFGGKVYKRNYWIAYMQK